MIRVSLTIAAVLLLGACTTAQQSMDHSMMTGTGQGAMAGCSMGAGATAGHGSGMADMAGMTGKPAGAGSMMMCGKPDAGAASGCMMAQGTAGAKPMGCCCSMMKHKS